jgi:plastocyanin
MAMVDRLRWATVVMLTMMITGLAACGSGNDASPQLVPAGSMATATYEYTIPAGAGVALDAGHPLDILPAELDARVGESIRIVNNDSRGHSIGPFFVGAGETMTQLFASPGEFRGVCTVHPSGQFVLVVRA